jgi:hypothetical protein
MGETSKPDSNIPRRYVPPQERAEFGEFLPVAVTKTYVTTPVAVPVGQVEEVIFYDPTTGKEGVRHPYRQDLEMDKDTLARGTAPDC